jgi:isopentenyldiphosphate isomerase
MDTPNLPEAWQRLHRQVASADHVVSRDTYYEIKRRFLASVGDLPALQEIAPEYGKHEFLLCVDGNGQAVAFARDVVQDFTSTASKYPDFGRWFAVAALPHRGDAVLLVARWLCHLLGIRHHTVLLFIDHPTRDDYTYVQVRGVNKAESPACFDLPAAGHIAGLETAMDALWQELEEELGLQADDVSQLRHLADYEYQGLGDESGVHNVEWRTVFVARLKAESALGIEFVDGEVAAVAIFALPALRDLLDLFPARVASALAASLPLYLGHRALSKTNRVGEEMDG